MEVTMTDKSVIKWIHEVLGVGTVVKKPRKGLRKDGTKYLMQWKWRCTFRDAFYVCCLLWPHAHTKLPKIQQILDHYSGKLMNDKVVSLEDYKNGNGFGMMLKFYLWVMGWSGQLSAWAWRKQAKIIRGKRK